MMMMKCQRRRLDIVLSTMTVAMLILLLLCCSISTSVLAIQPEVTSELDTCLDCFDTLIEAQECLRICDNLDAIPNIPDVNFGPYYLGDDTGSRLQQCLDAERGGQRAVRLPPLVRDTTGDGIPNVGGPNDDPIPPDFFEMQYRIDDMSALVECCEMESYGEEDLNCTSVMDDAQQCVEGSCIDDCLVNTTTTYFQCVQSNAKSGQCDAAGDCISDLLANSTSAIGLNSIDLDTLLDGYNNLLMTTDETTTTTTDAAVDDNGNGCALLDPLVDQVCGISNSCCAPCNVELANAMNCLINGVYLPYSQLLVSSSSENDTDTTTTTGTDTVDGLTIGVDDCTIDTPAPETKHGGGTCAVNIETNNQPRPDRQRKRKRRILAAVNDDGDTTDNEEDEELITFRPLPLTAQSESIDCSTRMSKDMVVANITYATSRYVGCMSEKAVGLLIQDIEIFDIQQPDNGDVDNNGQDGGGGGGGEQSPSSPLTPPTNEGQNDNGNNMQQDQSATNDNSSSDRMKGWSFFISIVSASWMII